MEIQRTKKERGKKSHIGKKKKLNVQVQRRPTFNKDSVLFSVSYVFKGVLQVRKTHLGAGVNLGPGTWIP